MAVVKKWSPPADPEAERVRERARAEARARLASADLSRATTVAQLRVVLADALIALGVRNG